MPINIEAIGKLSKRIEIELLKLFGGETGQKYKTKYRSLIFNLKDTNNKVGITDDYRNIKTMGRFPLNY